MDDEPEDDDEEDGGCFERGENGVDGSDNAEEDDRPSGNLRKVKKP